MRNRCRRSAPRFVWALAALIAVVPASSQVARAAVPIQPGSYIESSEGSCTLGFIVRDAGGALHALTAGHCAQSTGERIKDENGQSFGTLVYRENFNLDDISLIRIDTNKYSRVSAAVKHWGGPTGFTRTPETSLGDEIRLYGHGLGFGLTETTRPRYGVFLADDASGYAADTMAINGDSGGPILHARTGKALGLIAKLGVVLGPGTTDAGPTIERALARLAERGWSLTLQTASYGG